MLYLEDRCVYKMKSTLPYQGQSPQEVILVPSEATRSTPLEIIEQEKAAYRETIPAPDAEWPPDVRAVYKALQRRLFDVGLEAQAVAEDCGIGSHNVYGRFRHHTGQGIKEFILHHRLRLARRLLRHDSLSVSRIAFAVGYASSSGFCTTFKRKVGCTPTAVREREEE